MVEIRGDRRRGGGRRRPGDGVGAAPGVDPGDGAGTAWGPWRQRARHQTCCRTRCACWRTLTCSTSWSRSVWHGEPRV